MCLRQSRHLDIATDRSTYSDKRFDKEVTVLEYRSLGSLGGRVSRVGLGGLFVSELGGNDHSSAGAVVRAALASGINFIDTAPSYANSEELIGSALTRRWGTVAVSTKLGGRPEGFNPRNASHFRASFEQSLSLLRRDKVNLLLVHEPDRPGQYDWWDGRLGSGPVMDFLLEVKSEGLADSIGVAGTTAHELGSLVQLGTFDVVLTAFNYSLLWREAADAVIAPAARMGMTVIAGSPLQGGTLAGRQVLEAHANAWLSRPRREQLEDLYRLSDDVGISVPELAFRFVLSNQLIDVVLTGARSVAEVQQATEFEASGPLPTDVLGALDALAARLPCRPFEEPALLPFGRPYRGPGPLR